MFTLWVSHNCGINYFPERTAETVDELRSRMQELDSEMMRWYLDKDGKDYWEESCNIHKGILGLMETIESYCEVCGLPAEYDTDYILCPTCTLYESLGQLLDRLDEHGSIDPVREEGPIEDARNALSYTKRLYYST